MKSLHPEAQSCDGEETGSPPLLIHAKRLALLLMVSPATF